MSSLILNNPPQVSLSILIVSYSDSNLTPLFQEGASEELVSVLLGNKSDLPEEDGSKLVKMKDGIRLADVSSIANFVSC